MTSDPLILVIDQGTSSTRAILFDRRLRRVGTAQIPVASQFPRPGWVEQDPEAIWDSVVQACAQVLASGDGERVAGVGVTNQRETTVVWDAADGRAIHPAVSWQCRRTAARAEALRAGPDGERLRRVTGLVPDAYFSGPKIAWILDAVPGARARAERGELRFGTVDTFLVSRLTQGRVHATEPTNASRTLLLDIRSETWDEDLCRLMEVPRAMLPEVTPSTARIEGVRLPGCPGPVPIAGRTGDQTAALLGQRAVEAGQGKCTYGTGAFLLVHTGSTPVAAPGGLLTTPACRIDAGAAFALEGSVFQAGSVVQWLRDQLRVIGSAEESAALAAAASGPRDVFLVPAFAGLGAPYWDPSARGTVVGLTRATTREDLVRSALESIAHQVDDLLEAMGPLPGLRSLWVDGGAAANDYLLQAQADLSGIEVVRAGDPEATATGAALLAGIGLGLWDASRLPPAPPPGGTFAPRIDAEERRRRREGWRRAVERARGWAR